MSNIKKRLRALGAKVKKSQPVAKVDPKAALDANMAMFINAQGAFLQQETTKAREDGLKMGLGVDAAESLRLLAVENAVQREMLTRVIDVGSEAYGMIDEWLEKNPPQRFALKAVASDPTAPSGSPPEAEPPAPAEAPLDPAPPDAPPAGEPPSEAAPLQH